MSGPAPLDRLRLLEGLDEELFGTVTVLDEVGSTNVALVAEARDGASRGVLTTEFQSAGRGRLDRVWTAPPRSGLAVSVLLSPPVAARRWSWLPLVTGLAVVDALATAELPAGVEVGLKWPNDVLIGGAKVAGILAERVDERRVVVGMGLNVSLRAADLPVPTATSVLVAGGRMLDRTALLAAYLAALSTQCRQWWYEPDDTAVQDRYRRVSTTIGQSVDVALPDGSSRAGTAVDVDAAGALVVDTGSAGLLVVAAGDVRHVRVD
jgi:BirA family transcriptional regulator, biotin operon repressor / biotin---[acetyl-CoA-carboxylase] ligase